MTISAIRSVRAWLRIRTATACLLFFAATIARGDPVPAGAITYVGTDANIYYCDTKCAKPKCITCKAPATRVRREDAIVPVANDAPEQRPRNSIEYGLPTSPPA